MSCGPLDVDEPDDAAILPDQACGFSFYLKRRIVRPVGDETSGYGCHDRDGARKIPGWDDPESAVGVDGIVAMPEEGIVDWAKEYVGAEVSEARHVRRELESRSWEEERRGEMGREDGVGETRQSRLLPVDEVGGTGLLYLYFVRRHCRRGRLEKDLKS